MSREDQVEKELDNDVNYIPTNKDYGDKLLGMDDLSLAYNKSHGSHLADVENQRDQMDGTDSSSLNSGGLGDEKPCTSDETTGTGTDTGRPLSRGQSHNSTKNGGDGVIGEQNMANGHGGKGNNKVGFFHSSISNLRWKLVINYLKIWLYLSCMIIIVFSIYWGALYDREAHLTNLTSLVIIEDSRVDGIDDYIGQEILNLIKSPQYESVAGWEVYQGEDIYKVFNKGDNITDKILEKVHHREYWSAIHVYPNATYNQYLSYKNIKKNNNIAVEVVYESGRDITNMKPYVATPMQKLQASFEKKYASMAQKLIGKLDDDIKMRLVQSEVVSSLPRFSFNDYRPYQNNTLLAPLQVGSIYLIIVSFFLFNFFVDTHKILLPHVKFPQYFLYRFLGNQLSYLILSLFIGTVSAIFQIDFTPAFGKAGFVIYWFSTYLTMSAVGGASENVAMIVFTLNPPFVGFWLITWVILNVSPSFSPMSLTNHFYRFGYAMPIHSSSEIYKVIFLNIWKGQLGLYYGILVIWVVLNAVLSPFVLAWVGKTMAKRAKAGAGK